MTLVPEADASAWRRNCSGATRRHGKKVNSELLGKKGRPWISDNNNVHINNNVNINKVHNNVNNNDNNKDYFTSLL